MDYDKFREEHCMMCGSQRCPSDNEDIDTCGYNKENKTIIKNSEYSKSEALKWLKQIDILVKEYVDKLESVNDNNSIMCRYYGMKLQRACEALEIPIVTLS